MTKTYHSIRRGRTSKSIFDTIENFFLGGICAMNCYHEPNVLEVERRRDDYVDLNFYIFATN